MPNLMRVGVLLLFAILFVCSLHAGEKGGFADVNGIRIYYEIHGEGKPLLLLHGGLGSTDSWSKQLRAFSREFKVIAMDSRGHGRSTFDETSISYDLMTRDVIGLMDHLEIAKAHVVGWSDGGIIGLMLALDHPDRLDRLVALGACYRFDGVREDIMENPTFVSFLESAAADYRKISPAPQRWDEFMANIGKMWATEPSLTAEQLGAITAPVLIVTGEDEEVIHDRHTRELAELIPTAELELIPGTGHFACWEKAGEFNRVVLDFLERE